MNIPDLNPLDYTVAWIAPLPIELAAARALLDKRHMGRLNFGDKRSDYVFTAGEMSGHKVIIATLPDGQPYGNGSAAAITGQVKSLFHNLWFGLLVGVAAGLPDLSRHPPQDIRLGDVLVASAKGNAPAVLAYGLGKETGKHGFQLLRQGHALETAAPIVRSAISHIKGPLKEQLPLFLPFYEEIKNKEHDSGTFIDLGQEKDRYYTGNKAVARPKRPPPERTQIWYGTIGSGDTMMRYSEKRDALQKEHNLIGLEMEAAGTLNCLPVGVIRGVCDYGDEHKDKTWQPYAAAMAGAYAKAILAHITPWNSNQSPSNAMQNNIAIEQPIRSADDPANGTGDRSKRSRTEERDLGPHHPFSEEVEAGSRNEVSKEALLDSLAFQQIDARREDLGTTCMGTCQWLLKTHQYQCWSKDGNSFQHHGILWIKGKPGAGKSMLMNVALADAEKVEGRIVIFFFFHARGIDLRRCAKGMYRTLLHQLLTKLPRLQSVLPALKDIPLWRIQHMKVLFEKAVNDLGKSPLMVFIDGLDECEEEEIRDMVYFFRDVGGKAKENGIVFQVCFASRPYPNVTLDEKIELLLDQQRGHSEDILTYVNHNLQIGTDVRAQMIRSKLIEKAHGVFMWVRLVVKDLQTSFDGGNKYKLAERLEKTPGDLAGLFFRMLTRNEDSKDELRFCIQWILFARHPLNATELQHAILCGIEPQRFSDSCPLQIEESDAEKYILCSSKGLAEKTKSGAVQFIHESVRDFFLKDDRGKRALETLQPGLAANFEGKSHAELKRCCVQYIEYSHPRIDASIQSLRAGSFEADQARSRETKDFPLMQYATDNVLHHADEAHGAGVDQTQFLQDFDLANWVKLARFLETRPRSRYRAGQPSLLYVLSQRDAANLIECCPSNSDAFEREDQPWGSPIMIAQAMGNELAFSALLLRTMINNTSQQPELLFEEPETLLQVLKQPGQPREFWNTELAALFRLLCTGSESELASALASGHDVSESGGWELLFCAATFDNEPKLQILLDYDADRSACGRWSGGPVFWATVKPRPEILKRLLKNGADPNTEIGLRRRTPLLVATEMGQVDLVKLLLQNNAKTEVRDWTGSTPLHVASGTGQIDIVRMLLENKADTEAEDWLPRTPLIHAVRSGHTEIVRILSNQGANVNWQSDLGTPLTVAVATWWLWPRLLCGADDTTARPRPRWGTGEKLEALVKLLLQAGAKPSLEDNHGFTPLHTAVLVGLGAAARLLLQHGADVNQKGRRHSMLLAAVFNGNEAMVKLLIEFGAVIDCTPYKPMAALDLALGNQAIAQLLQESGAIGPRRQFILPIRTATSGRRPRHRQKKRNKKNVTSM